MLKSAKWLLVAGLVGSAGTVLAQEQQDTQSQDTQSQDTQSQDMQSQDMQSQGSQYQDTKSHDMKSHEAGKGGAGMTGMAQADDPQIVALAKVHQVNLAEVQLGQLAEKQALSHDVKTYAQRLVRDHQEADKKLMKLTEKEKITLSVADQNADIQSMKQENDAMLDKLRGLKGAEFDREFLTGMVTGHDKAIAVVSEAHTAFQKEPSGKLMGELLPKLRHHRDEAQKILDKEERTPAKARRPSGTTR